MIGKALVVTSGQSSFRSLLQCQRAQWESTWRAFLSGSPLLADRMPRVRYMFRNLSQQDAEYFGSDQSLYIHASFVVEAPRLLSFSMGTRIDGRVVHVVHDVRFKDQHGPSFVAMPLSEFLEFFKKVVDDDSECKVDQPIYTKCRLDEVLENYIWPLKWEEKCTWEKK